MVRWLWSSWSRGQVLWYIACIYNQWIQDDHTIMRFMVHTLTPWAPTKQGKYPMISIEESNPDSVVGHAFHVARACNQNRLLMKLVSTAQKRMVTDLSNLQPILMILVHQWWTHFSPIHTWSLGRMNLNRKEWGKATQTTGPCIPHSSCKITGENEPEWERWWKATQTTGSCIPHHAKARNQNELQMIYELLCH